MKKAQLLSQPFIYIFALILAALVLVFGIKMVMNVKETADLVDLGKFVKDFEAETKAFHNLGTGSMRLIPISLSGDVKFICFTKPESATNCQLKKANCEENCLEKCKGTDPLTAINKGDESFKLKIKNSKKNMWFLPLGSAKIDSYEIKYIEIIEGNPICYPNNAEIKLISTPTGVEIS